MAQSSSGPPASQPPKNSNAAPAKPARSPAERLIVWGGIIVLVGLVLFQARARVGYTTTLNALQERLAEDEGAEAKQLFIKDLDQYVVGWPSRKEEKKNEHKSTLALTWPGLSASYGIVVNYDPSEEGQPVIGLETVGFDEEAEDASRLAARNAESGPAGGVPAPDAQQTQESAPRDRPAEETEPVADKPAESAPAAETPAATEPAADKPADAAPAEKPAEAAPAAEKPAEAAPAATEEKKPDGN
ncbi:MAG: hypothetical protein U0992_20210 [Planctomycetaceae bacterium]